MLAKPIKYCFLTPVWGENYLNSFLNYGLPTQLSPGNIPAISNNNIFYQVFTTSNYIDRIRESEIYKLLKKHVSSSIVSIDQLNLSNALYAMTECYNMGLEAAESQDCAFVFLTPDSIWSDGSFYNMDKRAREGKRAVLIAGPRIIAESSLKELAERFPDRAERALCISACELVKLTMKLMHPISEAHIWDGKGNRAMAHYYWRVGESGMLMRCLHLHPLMVWPVIKGTTIKKNSTLDHDFVRLACPNIDQVYVVTDSDEIIGVDAGPLNHRHADIPENIFSLGAVINFLRLYSNDYHRAYFKKKIYFHSEGISKEWKSVEKESDRIVEELLAIYYKRYPVTLYPGMLYFCSQWGKALKLFENMLNKTIGLFSRPSAMPQYWLKETSSENVSRSNKLPPA